MDEIDTSAVLCWEGRSKRARKKPPPSYWEEYVATDEWYVKELIADVPEDELHGSRRARSGPRSRSPVISGATSKSSVNSGNLHRISRGEIEASGTFAADFCHGFIDEEYR